MKHKIVGMIVACMLLQACVPTANEPGPSPTQGVLPTPYVTAQTPVGHEEAAPAVEFDETMVIAQAEQHIAQSRKYDALSTIACAMEYTNESLRLQQVWWELLWRQHSDDEYVLSEEELFQISLVAYLVRYTDCFYRSSELEGGDRILPLYIYYSTAPGDLYEEYGQGLPKEDILYPADDIFDYGFIITQRKAQGFMKDVLDLDNFFYEPETSDVWHAQPDDRVVYASGNYYIHLGDYESAECFVERYAYLGDGLFYAVLAVDWKGVPSWQDMEDAEWIALDFMHLVLRKTDTQLGFTVIAKTKEDAECMAFMPENLGKQLRKRGTGVKRVYPPIGEKKYFWQYY